MAVSLPDSERYAAALEAAMEDDRRRDAAEQAWDRAAAMARDDGFGLGDILWWTP